MNMKRPPLVLTLLAAAAIGLGACERSATPASPTAAAPTAATSAPAPAATPALAEFRELGEYTDQRGFRRVYVLVAPGLDDEQITALAQHLHARENGAWLWFLDSDEQAAAMLAALPATEQGDTSTYPGKWVETHAVAHSVMEIVLGERRSRWMLYKGPYTGTLLATLPCPPSDKHCRDTP